MCDDATFHPEMNARQRAFVDRVCGARANTLLSGGAGTGKSFAIGEAERVMQDSGLVVVKLAHQGVSAVNIGGVTINQFLGIGLGRDPVDTYRCAWLTRLRRKDARMLAASRIDVVVIDELSQVPHEGFARVLSFIHPRIRPPTPLTHPARAHAGERKTAATS